MRGETVAGKTANTMLKLLGLLVVGILIVLFLMPSSDPHPHDQPPTTAESEPIAGAPPVDPDTPSDREERVPVVAESGFLGYSSADAESLHEKLAGEDRPAETVQRGRHNRRILPEHTETVPADRHGVPAHPFTGYVKLAVDEHLRDREHAKSAIALGISYSTFQRLAGGEYNRIAVPLEEDLSVTIRVEKMMERGSATQSYLGTIEEHPESLAQLIYNDGAVTGHLVLYSNETHPTRYYEIKYLSPNLVAMHKLDPTTYLNEPTPPLLLPGDDGVMLENQPANYGARVVDMVVGYGREARIADGGAAGIEARIIATMDRMNQAFDTSLIDGTMVLLGMIEDPDYLEADYPAMSDVLVDLNSVEADNPELNTVSDLLIELGADLQSFITNTEKEGVAGIAYVTGETSITARTYMTTTRFTFEHEVGHNFGAYHAWGDGASTGETDKTKRWHGWRFKHPTVNTMKRRTIMAYDNGGWDRVLQYSNPDLATRYSLGGVLVRTGAADGYNATNDDTVDPSLVWGGATGFAGSGYNGLNPQLGANVAWQIDSGPWGIVDRGSQRSRANLAVTRPQMGAVLEPTLSTPIEWVGGTWHSPARIELYKGGMAPANKVGDITSLAQNGYRVFSWTPGAVLPGNDYRIRIINNEGAAYEQSAFSGAFTIEGTVIVTFDANGGTLPVPATIDTNPGVAYGTLPTTTRPGYTFNGWFTQAAGGTQVTEATLVTQTVDHTLYAQWTPIEYTVTYVRNGGEDGSLPVNETHFYEDTVTVRFTPLPQREGHTFGGWNTQADGGGTNYEQGFTETFDITANTTLYANWVAVGAGTYTVTYNVNGGIGSVPLDTAGPYAEFDVVTVLFGPPLPTRVGYTFDGWKTTPGGGAAEYQNPSTFQMGNNHVRLYAHWEANPYTVTFEPHGGLPAPAPMVVTFEQQYGVLPNVSKAGFVFEKWTLTDNPAAPAVINTTLVQTAANHTLYAQYSVKPVITVTMLRTQVNETDPATSVWRIQASGTRPVPYDVTYLIGGTATPGVQYTMPPSPVTIAAGTTSVDLVLTPIYLAAETGNQTVVVTVAGDPDYDVGTPHTGTVTLIDNNAEPTVTLQRLVERVNETAGATGAWRVVLSHAYVNPLVIPLLVNGTATPGLDYVALNESVTVPALQTSADIMLTPIRDHILEEDESVSVTLQPGVGYTLGEPVSQTVVIEDSTGAWSVEPNQPPVYLQVPNLGSQNSFLNPRELQVPDEWNHGTLLPGGRYMNPHPRELDLPGDNNHLPQR